MYSIIVSKIYESDIECTVRTKKFLKTKLSPRYFTCNCGTNFLPSFYILVSYEIPRTAVFFEIDFRTFFQRTIRQRKKLRRKKSRRREIS